ncbi:hypothetical protein EXIGLDRAFT_263480 [Exidia glandulosa HHB12029]|uniref:Uncharacterized protein n=1 Tax=Exidia glandulosa HHB12029 TaxID=1314781 RepID=A0A165DQN9_EXIGL|nr:hypothetical protein EXIGLDRAFT_263480 [Exidia glandulosa HHB12029]
MRQSRKWGKAKTMRRPWFWTTARMSSPPASRARTERIREPAQACDRPNEERPRYGKDLRRRMREREPRTR